MSLLTVGTMAYDALETPFGKTDRILGGAATYIALSASYHVAKSNIVSVVGADFEQQHLDLLSGQRSRFRRRANNSRRKDVLLERKVPYGHE